MPAFPAASPAPEPDKAPTSSLELFLGYTLKRTFNALHAHLALTLSAFELRMVTYAALVYIVENPGLRQAQLADALKIERANAVAIVDELVSRKLVSRDRAGYDRRAYSLVATEAGCRLCAKALAADREIERQIAASLDPASVAQMVQALRQLETAAQDLLVERRMV